MTAVSIRPYHASDLPSLYRICHATGLNGRDASPSIPDPDLIGHSYVGPYAVLEPEVCFVAVQGLHVVGYIVATADSAAFHRKCEVLWFPSLRSRYPQPTTDDTSATAIFTRTLHRGHPPSVRIDLAQYPASLHIDLLPQAQGQGVGRQLMMHLFAELRKSEVPGVHLYVAASNTAAVGFYERIGFQCIDEAHHVRGYGILLS
jgi:ribosomal protein S18 acetylase RimI-like enzyme